MHPILFTLPDGFPLLSGSPIASYGVLLGLSLIVGWALAHRRLASDGLSDGRVVLVLGSALIAGLIGARALHLMTSSEPWRGVRSLLRFDASGATFWGGLMLGALVVLAVAKVGKAKGWRVLDRLAPALALGVVLTNVGVFLHGDNYGTETDSALAVSYPLWSPDDAVALGQPGPAVVVHHLEQHVEPVFGHVMQQSAQMRGLARSPVARGNAVLLEAPAAFEAKVQSLATLAGWSQSAPVVPSALLAGAVGLVALLGLLVIEHRRRFDGQVFLALVALLTVGRLAVDATRGDLPPNGVGPLSFTQLVAIGLFAVTVVLWLWRARSALRPNPSGADAARPQGSLGEAPR